MRTLHVLDRLGPEEYSAALDVQTNILESKIADRDFADVLIYVEHEEVYTVGRSEPFQKPPIRQGAVGSAASDSPDPADVPWVEVSRGGQATFHGPGQLVVYPVFDLNRHGKDVHVFLRTLEQVTINALARLGVAGETREGLTGVWVRTGDAWKKLVSIGIGVRKWVSYHGLALNVSTDLNYFKAISACGQEGATLTSLAEILRETPSMDLVKSIFTEEFCNGFELREANSKNPEDRESGLKLARRARPSWLKAKAPGSPDFLDTNAIVREHKLVTVCEEARCPNMGECWTHGTATFMIMGDLCTRRCSFCSVKDGTLGSLDPLDPFEPLRVAQAVQRLGLGHVVITSVNRDDIPDMGAEHFHKVVNSISQLNPDCDIELLIPDMRGKRALVESILKSGKVQVLNHNIETVPRLYKEVRPGAVFRRSLDILKWASEISANTRTKSGLMVGLGEKKREVLEVMDSLREVGVQVLTIGQYLQPTAKQLPVKRFVTPDEFEEYRREGLSRGFLHVESSPLVRSSYHAWKHTGDSTESTEKPASVSTLVG
jgi:lipoic acid synthetase